MFIADCPLNFPAANDNWHFHRLRLACDKEAARIPLSTQCRRSQGNGINECRRPFYSCKSLAYERVSFERLHRALPPHLIRSCSSNYFHSHSFIYFITKSFTHSKRNCRRQNNPCRNKRNDIQWYHKTSIAITHHNNNNNNNNPRKPSDSLSDW